MTLMCGELLMPETVKNVQTHAECEELVGRGNWKSQSKVAFGLMLFMPSPETGILSRKKMRKAENKTR